MADQCHEFLDRLERYLDNECNQDVTAMVEQHAKDCPPCAHRADFEARLREIVARSCRDRAPAGLADAVMTRLQLG